nr:MAG TPA: hypothetical protein [Caudoviricetes sp.]
MFSQREAVTLLWPLPLFCLEGACCLWVICKSLLSAFVGCVRMVIWAMTSGTVGMFVRAGNVTVLA